MKENDLRLAAEKIECVMLTKKRGYRQLEFIINDTKVTPKEKLKYLGIKLCKKIGYGTHI